jgi:hypothetical protein
VRPGPSQETGRSGLYLPDDSLVHLKELAPGPRGVEMSLNCEASLSFLSH